MRRFNKIKYSSFFLIYLLLISYIYSIESKTEDNSFIKTKRLSKRVLLLTEVSPVNNNILAINTKEGIVVIDSSISPITARVIRTKIIEEFGHNKFKYVILTHHHFDHAWGTQVFKDAEIVGHIGCVEQLSKATDTIDDAIQGNIKNRKKLIKKLSGLSSNSKEAKLLREHIAFRDRVIRGWSNDFHPTVPQKTFSDKLKLNLGDITIKLFYFGDYHSGTDIFVLIPEEGILLTGDIFVDRRFLPMFPGRGNLDINRWIKILGILLDGNYKIKYVIPGHKDVWTGEKLDLWRNYIVELWRGVRTAQKKNISLERFIHQFPLNIKYFYLKKPGHSEKRIKSFHNRNIKLFWKQAKK